VLIQCIVFIVSTHEYAVGISLLYSFVIIFVFLRQSLTMSPKLVWSFYVHLPSAGITSLDHHAWLIC
jgi:hypothetical protein